MGIMEFPAEAPDTFGLPEYRATEMRSEFDGRDIRLVFGAKRFGQIQWLYTVTFSPQRLLSIAHQCEAAAVRAINLETMLLGSGTDH